MNHYEAKQAARRDRLLNAADKSRGEGQAKMDSASAFFNGIPMGQPIHGAQDRRRREKHFDRGCDGYRMTKQAGELERRADAVGSGGISGDDPDAIGKLQVRLAALEANQKLMAGINRAWRKAKKPEPQEAERWVAIADAVGISYDEMAKIRLETAKYANLYPHVTRALQPFQAYALTNNNGNIHRIKGRIADLEKRAAAPQDDVETEINGVQVVENREENRLQLFFPGKPDAAMRAELKGAGFRWSPSSGAWQRRLSNQAAWQAERILNA